MDEIAVSKSELELLRILWRRSPLSLPELLAGIRVNCDWDESTVKTLLTRLVAKGAVKQEGKRRFFRYSPLLSQEEYREQAGRKLVEQAFDNDSAACVSFFVRRRDLSAADLAELRKLLTELDDHA